MKLISSSVNVLDLTRKAEPLTKFEGSVADYIAESLRGKKLAIPVGHYIYHVCQTYGVDHHRIARHLGRRNKK